MKYEITTKQDKKYTVSDENAWLWVEIERELGYTVSQAAEDEPRLVGCHYLHVVQSRKGPEPHANAKPASMGHQ